MFSLVVTAALCAVPDGQLVRHHEAGFPASLLEQARVTAHLQGALRQLRAVPSDGFSPAVWERRQKAISRLEQYTAAGVFPINDRYPFQTPIFVDDVGTRCAMGELIEASGGGALVARVHRENNLARIRDLLHESALVDWLAQNGFTVAEAIRVQPTYRWLKPSCGPYRAHCICSLIGALGELRITASDDKRVIGTLERIWGDAPIARRQVIDGGVVTRAPAAGAQFIFAHHEQTLPPGLAVGRKVIVTLNGPPITWWPLAAGQVSCSFDSSCAAPASIDLNEALRLAAEPCCMDRASEAGLGTPFCSSASAPFQVCQVDGGESLDFAMTDGGRWPTEACSRPR